MSTADLRPRDGQGESRAAVKFMLRGHYHSIAGLAVTAFLGGVLEALFLVTATRAAFAITAGSSQVGIVAGRFLSVRQTLLFSLVLVVTRVALALYSNWQSSRLSAQVAADLRRRLGRAFLRSSWPTQQAEQGGSLQDLLTTFVPGATNLVSNVLSLTLALTNLTALLGLAVSLDPVGAAVLIVTVVLLGSLLRPLRAIVRRRSLANSNANLQLAVAVSEASQLGMELHVFHVQDEAERRIGERVEHSRQTSARASFTSANVNPVYTALAYVALTGALALASYSTTTKLTSLGAVMLVMLRSLSYGQALQSAYTGISSSLPYVARVRERLEHFEQNEVREDGLPLEQLGALEVDHVSFSYVDGEEVIRDVSFTIEHHEVVGVIGPSGGGKSTLVQVLLGLRQPDSGEVKVNGVDIRSFERETWARRVTFVPQTAHLITGSIADNIRFLRSSVSQADIERAAKLAHLHEDIIGFPEGYDRQIGASGGQLSGGQQQRLCIARALVESPSILILDEPTSALDVRSEHLIRTSLNGLRSRMTMIIIAHRLSTLEFCDRIMVIQDGQVRGFDSPGNLERSNAFYREALELSGMR